ncbi:MAG: CDP-archaeol synthase [Syntrophobacter sp.]
MILYLKLLILLWLINFAPPFMALIFEKKWSTPIDLGHNYSDGRPFFGSHKTIRGFLAGVAAGAFMGAAMGFAWWIGPAAGVLGMSGDLLSSFVKRRLAFPSGDVVPGLDQFPEGFLPFLVLTPQFALSARATLACIIVFGVGAYLGSIFLNRVLLEKPFDSYPRKLRPVTRFRELVSCQISSRPLRFILNFEDAFYYHIFMKTVFRLLGIFGKGRRNALVVETREVSFRFPDLPRSFDGYRILFLTDLHLDGLEGLTEKLIEIVRRIPVDLCILGGDFRMETSGPFANALSHLSALLPEIRARDGIVAVLGNHDCIEIVEKLEEIGIHFLVNQSLALERGEERLWLAGVDDAHYFKCHNPEQAFRDVPKDAFSIFISHSNEIYDQVGQYGPRLYLCGHCHDGQIKIPPFGALFTHSRAPRSLCSGRWSYRGMPGYTSAGVGVSGVPVRFNTKGEVTVITLERE